MKNYILLSILLLSFFCCKKSDYEKYEEKQNMEKIVNKNMMMEKIGETYYQRNCIKCHASKSAKDNFLVSSIRNEKFEFEFLNYYITNQDSLIKNGNKEAIAVKENYNPNSAFNHNFKLNRNEVKSIVYYLKK